MSYTLSTVTGVAKRVHEMNLKWVGSRLYFPHGLVPAGTRVHVALRNSLGQTVYQAAATMGSLDHIELTERPRLGDVQILDITAGDIVVRSRMAPSF